MWRRNFITFRLRTCVKMGCAPQGVVGGWVGGGVFGCVAAVFKWIRRGRTGGGSASKWGGGGEVGLMVSRRANASGSEGRRRSLYESSRFDRFRRESGFGSERVASGAVCACARVPEQVLVHITKKGEEGAHNDSVRPLHVERCSAVQRLSSTTAGPCRKLSLGNARQHLAMAAAITSGSLRSTTFTYLRASADA